MSTTGMVPEDRFDPQVQPSTLQPLQVNIDDARLLNYLNALEKSANDHWDAAGPKGMNLKERRKQNIKYLFGKQLLGRDLKDYESEFLDNLIYEYEAILKSLAVSKLPDIIVSSGGANVTEQKKLTAELLTKANENRMLDRKFKKALGILFKHLPVYLIAVYKYYWDPSKNRIGDFIEEVINPENIVLDHTATEADPQKNTFIIHYIEKSAKHWIKRFPKKKQEILNFVKSKHLDMANDSSKTDWLLAQKIKAAEFWFDWSEEIPTDNPEEPQFEEKIGVAWKIEKDLCLGSSWNPNWDYEGHDSVTIDGQPVPPEIMEQIVLTGQTPPGFESKKVYNNYFESPRKPFIFMSFDQFLRSAIDETSRIEQTIPLQKSMDNVERQVDHMIDKHKGKHVWSKDSGMDKKALKKLDMDNPNSDVLVSGVPSNVHSFIQPAMPPQEMFVHIRNRRDRIFAKAGAHGATRGEITTDVATTNQISREADFTRSDDLVDETILHVATEIAEARLHMMKLRYTPEHWQKLLGLEEGKYLELRLDNDSIDDGMEVTVSASTVDKLRAERNAQGMANLKFIDPLNFYKDMNIPNPEERAEMLYLFNTNPALWYEKFVLKKDIAQIASEVVAASTPVAPVAGAVPTPPPSPATPPTLPSPEVTSNVATEPQGSPGGGVLGSVVSGIKGLLGR